MRKALLAAAAAAAGALILLGTALPAYAQTLSFKQSIADGSCSWTVGGNAALSASHYYRVAVSPASPNYDPCGYPVEAGASCYNSVGNEYINVWGSPVEGSPDTSFAPCTSGYPYFTGGGYRIDVNGTWQYHTELLYCPFGDCFSPG